MQPYEKAAKKRCPKANSNAGQQRTVEKALPKNKVLSEQPRH